MKKRGGFYFGPDILVMKNRHVVVWDVYGKWQQAYRKSKVKWKFAGKKIALRAGDDAKCPE